jgi:hypothetical protein
MEKQNTNKRQYTYPKLKKIGNIRAITLKTGSASDSSLPRVV